MDIRVTEDGSHTLFSDMAGQTYHSYHGAVTESNHIFINAGLDYWISLHDCISTPIRVLEVGFGTGLNDILSEEYAVNHKVVIDFSTIDLYPLATDVYEALNYGDILGCRDKFLEIHDSPWSGEFVDISSCFRIRKFKFDIVDILHEMSDCYNYKFDVIYFDAFSPDSQPELWSQEVFNSVFRIADEGCVLTTYCSKGDVRRAMISSGFNVEKLQGPPGKRHILRAVK